MKGIVCKEVGLFQWREDLPEPIRKPDEALVRIRRIGICGTDLHAYQGNQPFFAYPRVLGHELAGTIEEIGPNDAGLKAGDQVGIIPYLHCGACLACRSGKTNCCTEMKVMGVHVDGGMREKIAVPFTHLIATNELTLDQAAMLEPLAIGAHAVRRSGLKAGDTALIIGAGPIGLGVMAFARYAGARVIAMDINDERLHYCQSWAGAAEVVNARNEPEAAIAKLTEGDYPQIVFDATGNVQSMTQAFKLVAHGGTLVYVGLVKSDITFHDPDFHKREMTLMGSRNATREDFDLVLEAVSKGFVDIDRYITHRSTLEDMIEPFQQWLKPETGVIKAVVEIA